MDTLKLDGISFDKKEAQNDDESDDADDDADSDTAGPYKWDL